MGRAKRLCLFAGDLVAQLPSIWATARHNDCARNGGHRWGDVTHDNVMRSWGQTCSRCGGRWSVPFATAPTTTGLGSCSQDCERNDGHDWGDVTYNWDTRSWGSRCSHCLSWRSAPTPTVWMPAGATMQRAFYNCQASS